MKYQLLLTSLILALSGNVWAQVRAKPTPAITCDPGYHPECVVNATPVPTKTFAPPTAIPTKPPPTAVPTLPPPTVGPTIPVPIDTTKPTVKLTDPKSAQYLAPGSKYMAKADASDDVGVTSVQFKVYGSTGCVATAPPWQCEITMNATGTMASVTAVASDAAGNTATHEVTVYLGTPSVTPVPPTPGPTSAPTVAPTVAPPTPGPSPTAAPTFPPSAGMPAPVLYEVDVTLPSTPSKWMKPTTAAEFQQALDTVAPGEGIELQAGTRYVGNFKLKPKAIVPAGLVARTWAAVTFGTALPLKIWIRSSGYAQLPAQGTRAGSGQAQMMATIVSPNNLPSVAFIGPASNYYLSGIEITTTWSTTDYSNYGLVALGYQDAEGYNDYATSADQLPDQVVFDRVYIHGTPTGNVRRGITMNTRAFGIIDSSITEIHEVGRDNQAIGGWNGTGPFLIRNNLLMASCENFMMGGADTKIPNNTPSDMVFEKNLVTKDPAWRGSSWSVKNSFELKHLKRSRIRFNTFDWWWPSGQAAALQFSVRNQDGTNPWATIEDIEFSSNRIGKNIFGPAVSFLSEDSPVSGGGISQHMKRMLFENNLFEYVEGFTFQLLGGPIDMKIRHNTSMVKDNGPSAGAINFDGSPPASRLVYTDNLIGPSSYFIFGSGSGAGDTAIAKFAPDMQLVGNVFYGPWPTGGGVTPSSISGHPGNFFPASRNVVGFADLAGGNYALSANSPYKGKATDGKDIGADTTKLP